MLQVPIQNSSRTSKLLVSVTTADGVASESIEPLQSRIIDLPPGGEIGIKELVEAGNGSSSELEGSASNGGGADPGTPGSPVPNLVDGQQSGPDSTLEGSGPADASATDAAKDAGSGAPKVNSKR